MEQLPSKGKHPLKFRGTECLNCGHTLDISDKYCPNCSQINSTKKPTLKDLVREFFGSIISYDSKILKTLTAMLLHPGRITKDYLKGKRITYTNPFRFLLSLAIIYFLIFSYTQNFSAFDDIEDLTEFNELDSKKIEADQEQEEALKIADSIQKDMARTLLTATKDSIILANPKKYFDSLNTFAYFKGFYLKTDFFMTLLKNKRVKRFNTAKEELKIPENYQNRKSFDMAKSLLKAVDQPGTFLNFLISKIPFFIFFFLPVFALFIWLMYVRKKHNYIEHLIFSFHIQSLLFILLLISFIIDAIFKTASGWIFLLIFSVYLYKAMRNFYGQGRLKTFVKYLILNTVFFILAVFSIIILFTGTIFTY
ncbi:DUF3667 domain-containing protein [Flavobacteriaceae bacterium KMM 6897]|nr:DUF3667 domain-containing protein [Flavobacteriaceae bacterium KMM 6897]MEB8345044.1 DUF3667 domain-containing protein [Flavobacteriaceae bacterium KMM 6898]